VAATRRLQTKQSVARRAHPLETDSGLQHACGWASPTCKLLQDGFEQWDRAAGTRAAGGWLLASGCAQQQQAGQQEQQAAGPGLLPGALLHRAPP
jgi:hypothetical protein